MTAREMLSARFLVHVLVVRPLLWAIFGVNIRGREYLAALDRFIIVSNHNSHLDTLLLYATLPKRQILKTRAVAASDYFARSRWLFRVVTFLFRPIWVDRSGERGRALPEIQRALDAGANVILFPEGTRGEAGELREFRGGIGRIVEANRSIPVVAVFLEGPERALPRRAPFPLPLWNHVTIAPPQFFRGEGKDVTRSLQTTLADLQARAGEARQRRPAPRTFPFTVAVLGVDGSGKSTLSRRLAATLSTSETTCLIGDRLELHQDGGPAEFQPLIADAVRRWIGAKAKKARSLGRYKIPKLAEILLRDRLLREAHRWYRPTSVFMDGMPLLNLSAWSVLYGRRRHTESACATVMAVLARRGNVGRRDAVFEEFPELARLRQLRLDSLSVPDASIFLDVPPSVCIERIDSRGAAKQVHENEETLSKLREAYLLVTRVMEREWGVPVAVIDGNRALDEVHADALEFVLNAKEGRRVI